MEGVTVDELLDRKEVSPGDFLSKRDNKSVVNDAAERRATPDQVAALYQKTVNRNSNPSPFMIACIVLLCVFLVWLIHVLWLKPSMDGLWYDAKGNVWQMDHNRLTGTVDLWYNGQYYTADLIGQWLEGEGISGAWDGRNKILLYSGTLLTRLIN